MPRGRRPRKTAEEQPAAAAANVEEQMESGVRDLEDAYFGMRDRLCDMLGLPEDFGLHLKAAQREILLAVRSLLDARIERLEADEREKAARQRSRVTIE